MVGILVSFWDGLFSGAMLVLGRVASKIKSLFFFLWGGEGGCVLFHTWGGGADFFGLQLLVLKWCFLCVFLEVGLAEIQRADGKKYESCLECKL